MTTILLKQSKKLSGTNPKLIVLLLLKLNSLQRKICSQVSKIGSKIISYRHHNALVEHSSTLYTHQSELAESSVSNSSERTTFET